MKVAIIGGGAAGFFSAISAKTNYPDAKVVLFERSKNLMAKIRISGGGRCNVTNNCPEIPTLLEAYPRGKKKLKKVFHIFNTQSTMEWFESRGVPLVTQEHDKCVFPVSQNSDSIINCLLMEADKLGVDVRVGFKISGLIKKEDHFELETDSNPGNSFKFDKVIVATGGSPKKKGLEWLERLGHKIESPVPSLFTFNMPNEPVKELMGIVVENAMVSIQGTKLKATGPLLITHWGMSGPAVLKTSSLGARLLSEMDYSFKVQVNWVNEKNNDEVLKVLTELTTKYSKKILSNIRPYYIPERLWHFLVKKCGLTLDKRWGELGKKGLNRLVIMLTNDTYEVQGKTTFREEFVTCGGVSLESINMNSMHSKVCEGLYFAGEVMDIDGITGGYNLQSSWTTGFIAGRLG